MKKSNGTNQVVVTREYPLPVEVPQGASPWPHIGWVYGLAHVQHHLQRTGQPQQAAMVHVVGHQQGLHVYLPHPGPALGYLVHATPQQVLAHLVAQGITGAT